MQKNTYPFVELSSSVVFCIFRQQLFQICKLSRPLAIQKGRLTRGCWNVRVRPSRTLQLQRKL